MKKKGVFDSLTQVLIPVMTVSAQVLIAAKQPGFGLIVNLVSQPFWIYSGWKSYKEAGQSGILVTAAIMSVVCAFGVINYWFL